MLSRSELSAIINTRISREYHNKLNYSIQSNLMGNCRPNTTIFWFCRCVALFMKCSCMCDPTSHRERPKLTIDSTIAPLARSVSMNNRRKQLQHSDDEEKTKKNSMSAYRNVFRVASTIIFTRAALLWCTMCTGEWKVDFVHWTRRQSIVLFHAFFNEMYIYYNTSMSNWSLWAQRA